ncbi:Formate hydrogenlyase transcriptional activator FhlA [Pseudomonas aeruginosa]|nr:Formate hydrogenlyase transcriptional activator FhlA [Pseudomonas aeruginosa]
MNDADSLQDYQRVRQQAIRSLFEIVEGSSEGTVIVDREARIVWINQRYAQRFASDPRRPSADPESVIPVAAARSGGSGKPILLDMMDSAKDPLVVMRLPIHDDAGEVIGAIGLPCSTNCVRVAAGDPLPEHAARTGLDPLAIAGAPGHSFSHFVGTSPASLEVKRRAPWRGQRRCCCSARPAPAGTARPRHPRRAAQGLRQRERRGDPGKPAEAEFFGTAPGPSPVPSARAGQASCRWPRAARCLDEIGDMPLALQGKLLRVLQEKEFEAVGSNEVIRSDIRLVAATSIDLQQAMREGRFRADLYYRLNVLPIEIPPLRQRLDDLPALCESILDSLDHGRLHELGGDALALLARHAWPGNVRELRNVLERALLLADQRLLDAAALGAALGPASCRSCLERRTTGRGFPTGPRSLRARPDRTGPGAECRRGGSGETPGPGSLDPVQEDRGAGHASR